MSAIIYRYLDYRDALSQIISERKTRGEKISYAELARKIRIQNTYLSRVIQKKAHLNPDQLHALCDLLTFSKPDKDYLQLLLEAARSEYEPRQKELRAQIHELQISKKHVRNHLESKMVEPPDAAQMLNYYLDPYIAVIHMFVAVGRYAVDPSLIAKDIGITKKRVTLALKTLTELGFIAKSKKGVYEVLAREIFIPGDSPVSFASDVLSRHMQLEHLQRLEPDQRFLISLNFSADESTRKRIHEEFLKFLRVSEKLIHAAPTQQVYRLNFDLFPWSLSANEAQE